MKNGWGLQRAILLSMMLAMPVAPLLASGEAKPEPTSVDAEARVAKAVEREYKDANSSKNWVELLEKKIMWLRLSQAVQRSPKNTVVYTLPPEVGETLRKIMREGNIEVPGWLNDGTILVGLAHDIGDDPDGEAKGEPTVAFFIAVDPSSKLSQDPSVRMLLASARSTPQVEPMSQRGFWQKVVQAFKKFVGGVNEATPATDSNNLRLPEEADGP